MKSLENLLKCAEKDDLSRVVNRAHDMGELVQKLQLALPQPMGAHIMAANVRDNGQLVVLASSPAWAAKLRFETDRMLAIARKTGVDARSCKVRVSRDANTA